MPLLALMVFIPPAGRRKLSMVCQLLSIFEMVWKVSQRLLLARPTAAARTSLSVVGPGIPLVFWP